MARGALFLKPLQLQNDALINPPTNNIHQKFGLLKGSSTEEHGLSRMEKGILSTIRQMRSKEAAQDARLTLRGSVCGH